METRTSQMSEWTSKPTLVSSQLDQTGESILLCWMTSFHKGASLFFHSGTTLQLNATTPVSCLHYIIKPILTTCFHANFSY